MPENCDRIRDSELAQKYVLGELTEADRESYELHYFECERCFDDLRNVQAIRSVLESAPRARAHSHLIWRVGAIAAAVVLASLVGWQLARLARDRSQQSTIATNQAVPKPAATAIPGAADRVAQELQQLAQIDPPPYRAPVLRGADQANTDRFRKAMQSYAAHDYRAAIPGLALASKQDPSAPAPLFYLGVCYLIEDQAGEAGAVFTRAIALGNTPYLELAHFYLAKALLKARDTASAQRQLRATVALRGDKRKEAQTLLDRLLELQGSR